MKELLQKLVAKAGKKRARHEADRFLRQDPGLRNLLAEIERQSESVGMSTYQYVSLYRMVRRIKPACVLECGTGKSTFVIARAMCENGNGRRLVSLEESADWAAKQKAAIDYFFSHARSADWFPGGDRSLIELIHSRTTADQHRCWAGIRYADYADYPYDFVLVDGPALTDSLFVNLDLIHILKHLTQTVSIWIDGRWAVAAMCRAFFGDKVVHRPGWSHTEVYRAERNDLYRDRAAVSKELKRILR